MSDRDNDAGLSGADDDASLFNAIVGGGERESDAGGQHGDERQVEGGEGDDDEGQGDARERDDQGRFAKPEQRQEGRRDGQGEDRAQRGLRKEVTGERGKRQEAEAKASAFERQLGEMRAQMDMLARQQVVGQQPGQKAQQAADKPQAPAKPDRYTDPEAYDQWIEDRAVERANAAYQQQAVQRADYALDYAKQRDPQGFEAAVATLRTLDPQANAAIRQRMLMVPDAGSFLLEWHKQEQARREIGGDPNGFRERVRSDVLSNPSELMKDPAFAQAVTDYLRQQAGQGGRDGGPRTENRLPPSLNASRGSNVQRGASYGNSDRDVFEEVMRT